MFLLSAAFYGGIQGGYTAVGRLLDFSKYPRLNIYEEKDLGHFGAAALVAGYQQNISKNLYLRYELSLGSVFSKSTLTRYFPIQGGGGVILGGKISKAMSIYGGVGAEVKGVKLSALRLKDGSGVVQLTDGALRGRGVFDVAYGIFVDGIGSIGLDIGLSHSLSMRMQLDGVFTVLPKKLSDAFIEDVVGSKVSRRDFKLSHEATVRYISARATIGLFYHGGNY